MDVIVSFGCGVDAAANATKTIPIVGLHSDPVQRGLAESVARPGRNVTGMTSASTGPVYQKQLALLKEASPRIARVALVAQAQGDQADQVSGIVRQPWFSEAAKALGLELLAVSFGDPGDLRAAIRSAARQGAQALLFDEIAILAWREHQQVINEEARLHRLPVMQSMLGTVEKGGLMAYGTDPLDTFRRLPFFVDRILKGASNIVLLNAGAAIYVAGCAETLAEGIAKAHAAIESGAAREKLRQLVEVSNRFKGA